MGLDCISQFHAWHHKQEYSIDGLNKREWNFSLDLKKRETMYKIHVVSIIYIGFYSRVLQIVHVCILSSVTVHTHSSSLVFCLPCAYMDHEGGVLLVQFFGYGFAWGISERVSYLSSLNMPKM